MIRRQIFCCACHSKVGARLTSGAEIYPHRPDLRDLPFWRCDDCGNYVGCHYKTKEPTRPLGNIPSPTIMNARKHIHRILDPLWANGKERRAVYAQISERLGREYHTGKIASLDEARQIYAIVRDIARQRTGGC